jgi:hypothetical protein
MTIFYILFGLTEISDWRGYTVCIRPVQQNFPVLEQVVAKQLVMWTPDLLNSKFQTLLTKILFETRSSVRFSKL